MSPLDLFQAARDGYEEWRSEQEDDDENDEIDNQVDVKWTRPYIFHAGLNLLSRSPGQQMDRDELLKQIPLLIPEDANEALSSYGSEWVWDYCYTKFYRGVKAGWLIRKRGCGTSQKKVGMQSKNSKTQRRYGIPQKKLTTQMWPMK